MKKRPTKEQRMLFNGIRIQPCIACESGGGNDLNHVHHIITKGSRPDLEYHPLNLMSLCYKCHHAAHSVIGLDRFYSANINCVNYMIQLGWEYDEYSEKWINENFKKY